ncbi:MAG: universal stress protein [Candidatus Bathyarchaeia archaeon]
MISKILVAVDGSTEAGGALDYATFLAKTCGASLGAIHVIEPPATWAVPPGWSPPTPPDNLVHDEHQTYRRMIQVIEANGNGILAMAEVKVKAAGLTVEKVMESGHPADRIVKVASDKGYDLIVMGSRGNSGIKEMLLGSVSHHVCQHAKCSVLIAR